MDYVNFIISTVVLTVVALFFGPVFLGIERKIQARIQQRIGPPILTPGTWSILKFWNKKPFTPNSPMPSLYHALPPVTIVVVLVILWLTSPEWWGLPLSLATLVAIVGIMKFEEVMYVVMGSLSRSILSVTMPYGDVVKGAVTKATIRRFFEGQSAVRFIKHITIASFPIYIAIFIPVVIARSIFVQDVVLYQGSFLDLHPILFTVPGFVGAIVYFVGYVAQLNDYPFTIAKAKGDLVEGAPLEYGAHARGNYYILRGVWMFVLSSLFVTLFFGIPPVVDFSSMVGVSQLVMHVLLTFMLPVLVSVLSAFGPILTFKQLYPVSFGFTAIGVFGLLLAL
ncbi:MAG: NADH-quinone oxidoreductase subunit H [Theionarchaea archaeon]|nr:NADH-quinone oxidoreductase subunit H [Theionarchaea archaeon]MBU6999998.1 NADH-quinone oxidoreductase subunit H [Theionarchaea archaeon]MBU7021704.1 NADH-quinone oxidoreductase subunit H [Theionarchaea archaeon]MBU7034994.1 NADH-quinone oxidoreductase subunit H [Theionarchaea archaeon]MBU7040346.1 NADH-quinone oxidoreductase subunit H [Theionarchaea archaeon]